MTDTISYVAGAELAATQLWLWSNNQLVDLATGYTITAILGRNGDTIIDKTSGITGQTGTGTEPDGTPNVTVAWAIDELDLPSGRYELQIQARTGATLDYRWVIPFNIARGYDPLS